ncbi:MAG: hypothetical protein EA392_04900 [Cryomorphaceae bacterium]|nr:MAG: hypothetical protein EA392_04900 [Cryomorphaceae bacterium]
MMKTTIFLLGFGLWTLLFGCSGADTKGKWIKGEPDDQLEAIERHFRGFDVAMVETGYRYKELYWAGMDENWEYARYQLEKIKVAVENGLERRPARAASAQPFLKEAIPGLFAVLDQPHPASFEQEFKVFTAHCNSCHQMENVPHFTVRPPKRVNSIIQQPAE